MNDYRITKIKSFSESEQYTFETVVYASSIADAMSRARRDYPDASFEGAHCKML